MIINYSIQWYLFIQLLAIIAFVLTFKVFANLKDQSYTISKAIGILLTSFIAWLIMSYNGGTFEFSSSVTYVSTGILAVISIISLFTMYSKEDRKALFHFLDKKYKLIILTEIIFIGILIFGAYVRAFNPDILGVNKLPEYVYINSILSTNSLPPENLWFSGYKVNLYYYGYFIIAFLSNLSKIPLEYAFNLVPGTIIALISVISGGIIYNITERKTYAFLGALLTGFGANYVALRDLISKGITEGFNWWDSAHFLPNNIFTEFPFWSMILGDIEPFYLSSFIILTLIYLIHSLTEKGNPFLFNKNNFEKIVLWILIIITAAGLIISNILALPITIILISLGLSKSLFREDRNKKDIKLYLLTLATCFIAIALLIIPFISKYLITYNSIRFLGKEETLSITNLILLAGAFLAPIIILIINLLKETLKTNWKIIILIGISALSLIEIIFIYKASLYPGWLWIIISIPLIIIAATSIKTAITSNNNTDFKKLLGILAILFLIFTTEILITNNPTTIFSIVLMIASIYIIAKSKCKTYWINGLLLFTVSLTLLLSDTIYLQAGGGKNDITSSYLLIQMLLILPIASTISIFISFKDLKIHQKDILTTVLSLIILPCFIFTILASYYRTNKFAHIEGLVPNLSGINHMEVFHKPDFETIEWLKWNTPKNSIILEAIKADDVYHGRISGYSGRKAILAWPGSKLFAYGPKIKEEVNNRIKDINKIYSEQDKTQVTTLLNKYDIEYIYVGELEKKLYPEESLNGFEEISTLEFQPISDKSYKLYKLKRDSVD